MATASTTAHSGPIDPPAPSTFPPPPSKGATAHLTPQPLPGGSFTAPGAASAPGSASTSAAAPASGMPMVHGSLELAVIVGIISCLVLVAALVLMVRERGTGSQPPQY